MRTFFFVTTRRLTFAVITALSFAMAPAAADLLYNLGEVDPYDYEQDPDVYNDIPTTPATSDLTFTVDTFGIGQRCPGYIDTPGGLCVLAQISGASGVGLSPYANLTAGKEISLSDPNPNLTIDNLRMSKHIPTIGGRFVPGTYDETIGVVHAFRAGVPLWTETLRATYSIAQPPCDVSDDHFEFGNILTSDVGTTVLPITLNISCPSGVNTSKVGIYLSSPKHATYYILDTNGGNVQLALYRDPITTAMRLNQSIPGLLSPGSNQIELLAKLSTEGGAPATPGNFRMVLDIEIVYP